MAGFTYSDGEQETLSNGDLGLCFAAKDKLVTATIMAFLNNYSALPAGTCKLKAGDDTCRRARRCLSQCARSRAHASPLPNPMVSFNITLTGADAPRLCEICGKAIKVREQKRQTMQWKKLPSMLGIDVPGW